MYAVIRKFNQMSNVDEAARRAEDGLVPILSKAPGFRGYYIVKAGGTLAVSITIFESEEAGKQAHQRALSWINDNLSDVFEGTPEVIAGQVLLNVSAETAPAE
jgi:hypothetical protein